MWPWLRAVGCNTRWDVNKRLSGKDLSLFAGSLDPASSTPLIAQAKAEPGQNETLKGFT